MYYTIIVSKYHNLLELQNIFFGFSKTLKVLEKYKNTEINKSLNIIV